MKIRKTNKPSSNGGLDPEEFADKKKWYEQIVEDSASTSSVPEENLIALKDEAKRAWDSEVANYNSKNPKGGVNLQWMKTMMSKGTISDKIAAFTVTIQDNPVCSLETLRNLVGMVKVGKKKECIAVIETLSELFLSDLLIPHRKLKAFHQRPLALLNEMSSGNAVTRRKLLSTWYFEDQLKETYTTFVLALNTVAHDTVDKNKEKGISAMYKLLAGNPEQEKNLLAYIVNKLGDPSQKVASKTIYCLTQLLHKHSNMQPVVLAEVEKLLFRANISTRAQYYGLCFLSQFYLGHDDPQVARKLIEVYFSFFNACIKKGEVDSRMMSALLMGVNRAYPYAKLENSKISQHIDTMYKIVHLASFNVGLHALTLLFQVSDFANDISDRYYSALYRKLFDPRILTSTHHAMLLNLIYKALLRDKQPNRVKTFVKRLLQIALYTEASFSCGILYLVSNLIKKSPEIQALILKQTNLNIEGDDDDEEEKYADAKLEDDIPKVEEEENSLQEDAKPEEGEFEENKAVEGEKEEKFEPVVPSWFHRNSEHSKNSHNETKYDPLKRNPLYAGGDFCAYDELILLKSHFHPSVTLFAEQILNGESIKYSGDPLKDFTLIRFLDRFVFKNPKQAEDTKQGAHPTFGIRKHYRPFGLKALPVVSSNYLNEQEKNIPRDELFLYTYLQKKYKEKGVKAEDEDDESDADSVASEEFEEMLSKMSGLPDDDEEIDYMNEIGTKLQKKKKGSKPADDEDAEDQEDEDLDDTEEFSDDQLSEDEDFKDDGSFLDEDDDLSDISFDSEDDKEEQPKKSKRKSKTASSESVFASAEEFASLLEDEGSSQVAPGGSNAVANKDNAHLKQIAWEEKRNVWLQGYNKAIGKKGGKFKGQGGKKRQFNKRKSGGEAKGSAKKRKKF